MTLISKASIKVVLINLLVFFTIANLLYWAIPTINALNGATHSAIAKIRQFSSSNNSSSGAAKTTKPKWSLLAEFSWAQDYEREWGELTTSYYSYVAWRRQPFSGKAINIVGPYHQRRTINEGSDRTKTAYFFGGSTVWGTGSDDSGTIPSQFAKISGIVSENFGESGYTAHQNLVSLIQLLQNGHRPHLVVFYNGINEVNNKCRHELTPTSHGREQQIRTILASNPDSRKADSKTEQPNTFRYYMKPLVWLASKTGDRSLPRISPSRKGLYDCDTDLRKAEHVAQNLIKDWEIAKLLVESNGGKFIGILQPVAHYTKSPVDHLELSEALEAQYHAVYPKMRAALGGQDSFFDLVTVLDTELRVYMDLAHITPHGNRIVAQKIAEIVAPLGFAPRLQARANIPGN